MIRTLRLAALLAAPTIAFIAALAAVPVVAQEADEPLSAIDWLSSSLAVPDARAPTRPGERPVAQDATVPEVTVSALDAPSADPIGILPPAISGLPRDLWSGSDEEVLIEAIAALGQGALPAMTDLQIRLMLAEADPPRGARGDGALFLARVDRLLDLGALDAARELLEAADPVADPRRFQRLFDVALLTGTEDPSCRTMEMRPDLASTLPARVFCLARGGDWNAAALTLNTATALGDVTEEEAAIVTRFLDDGLDDTATPLPTPRRTTPLVFRLYEAIGEALPTADLPLAFARADLRPITAWRLRMEAAERLARAGAVSETTIFPLYTEASPGASGGVWDRASAIQAFEAALEEGDVDDVADTLQDAWEAMTAARLEVPFARAYGAALAALPLPDEAGRLAHRLLLLGPDYEAAANERPPFTAEERLLRGVARGDVSGLTSQAAQAQAVLRAFSGQAEPLEAAPGQLGQTLLEAIALFEKGRHGDPAQVARALATFRSLGLEDDARRAALQYLILERDA